MTKEIFDATMSLLKERAAAVGSEVRLDTLDNGVQLLSFLTPVHDDGSGLVLFQISLICESGEWELAQIVSTLQPSIGAALPELEKAVARWNFTALLGCYGIYYEGDQFYHKYRLLLSEPQDAQSIVERVMDSLALIYDELTIRFDAANAIVTDGLTFEQAQANGLC